MIFSRISLIFEGRVAAKQAALTFPLTSSQEIFGTVVGNRCVHTTPDGLHIVEALCERWGEEREDGYRVWADIDLSAADRSPTAL